MYCTYHQISLGRSNRGEGDGQGMWMVLGTRKMCASCWWETLEKREHWEHLGVEGMVYITVVEDLGWNMEWINPRSWLFWDVTYRKYRVTQDKGRCQPLVNRVTNI